MKDVSSLNLIEPSPASQKPVSTPLARRLLPGLRTVGVNTVGAFRLANVDKGVSPKDRVSFSFWFPSK